MFVLIVMGLRFCFRLPGLVGFWGCDSLVVCAPCEMLRRTLGFCCCGFGVLMVPWFRIWCSLLNVVIFRLSWVVAALVWICVGLLFWVAVCLYLVCFGVYF